LTRAEIEEIAEGSAAVETGNAARADELAKVRQTAPDGALADADEQSALLDADVILLTGELDAIADIQPCGSVVGGAESDLTREEQKEREKAARVDSFPSDWRWGSTASTGCAFSGQC
jgi:hypothetical protein